MAAVSGILLVIIMSGRFVAYLAKAASGDLSADVLLQIMALRLPGFLELILPLGLFLGVLLGYGRLYLDSEMAVLYASGVSQRRLICYAMGPAGLTAAIVAVLSLYVTPLAAEKIETIWQQQEARPEIERITPGRFQVHNDGRVTYVETVSEDGRLRQVFMAQRGNKEGSLVALLSDRGQKVVMDGEQFLLLEDGRRYEGQPGRFDYIDTRFLQYGLKIKNNVLREETTEIEAVPTLELFNQSTREAAAQLHWRLGLPLLAIIVTLIAVPLSRVNPRQGRYARLVPSILIYLLYLTVLSSIRSKVEDGAVDESQLWVVHGAFLLLAINLIFLGGFWARLFNRIPVLRLRNKVETARS